jgi:thiol-disulfide isomerase/thioredoxin
MKYIKQISIIVVLLYLIFLGVAVYLVETEVEEKQTTIIDEGQNVTVIFFYADGCSHCVEKKPIIDYIEEEYEDNITLYRFSYNEYKNLLNSYGFSTVPAVVIQNQTNTSKFPYIQITLENLMNEIDAYISGRTITEITEEDQYLIDTPFGQIDLYDFSLPVLTIVLGALDSINPCSFFILLFLLNLLLYVRSRRRMVLIGGIFIFFSGFIYFILMALILTTFIIIEQPLIITVIAGVVALILGAINIKDFFYFKQGLSLSISEDKKKKLFSRMRNIVKITHLPTLIISTILLAIFANTYELACTLALPVVFTDFLANIYNVPLFESYLYIFLYNVVYVIPLIVIVSIFVITLGRRKLTEYQGRILKLISGVMMASFGIVLLLNPGVLKNIFIAVGLLLGSILVSILLSIIWKKFNELQD